MFQRMFQRKPKGKNITDRIVNLRTEIRVFPMQHGYLPNAVRQTKLKNLKNRITYLRNVNVAHLDKRLKLALYPRIDALRANANKLR